MASAYAYFRLAAKADRAGNGRQGEQYREIAYRLVRQDQAQRAWMASRKAK